MRRTAGVVALDLLFMGINFSALTLFSTLHSYISSEIPMTGFEVQIAAAAYSVGIFGAFFLGHSRLSENYPKLTVVLASLFAAIPQFLIPLVSSGLVISILRFLQGLVMMAVPIFSAQVGKLLSRARPFALGIILSGIFIGGLIGAKAGIGLQTVIGWRATYMVFGLLMVTTAFVWWFLTPEETLPTPRKTSEQISSVSVWRIKFTWVWGFTFFPSIWIIFTLAPLIHFIVSRTAPGFGQIASEILEASYLAWSIAIGALTYVLARRSGESPKELFTTFAKVQALCFVISAAGATIAFMAGSVEMLLLAIVLIAVIQGTAPTFWSVPSTAYSENVVTKAGYALGLISNSAALVGPLTSVLITSISETGMWLMISLLGLVGLITTLLSLRIPLPREGS